MIDIEHTFIRSLLIGFGQAFVASAAPLLVTELAYPTQRAQLTSVYNTLWLVYMITTTFIVNNCAQVCRKHYVRIFSPVFTSLTD